MGRLLSSYIHFDPCLKFEHDCSRTSKSLSGDRLYYMVRNGIRVIKMMPISYRLVGLPLKLISWVKAAAMNKALNDLIRALKDS